MDIKKLPDNFKSLLTDILIPLNPDTPVELLVLALEAKLAFFLTFERFFLDEGFAERPIPLNMYALIFYKSGGGKGRVLSQIDNYILGRWLSGLHEEWSKDYEDNKHFRVKTEAEKKYPGLKSKQAEYLERYGPRQLAGQISNATTEGLAVQREMLQEWGRGSTLLNNDEFGKYITISNTSNETLIEYLKTIADMGDSDGKSIKGEKEVTSIRNVPNNIIFSTSLYPLREGFGRKKLIELLASGLARRSFIVVPTEPKVASITDEKNIVLKNKELEQEKEGVFDLIDTIRQLNRNVKMTDEAKEYYFNWKHETRKKARNLSNEIEAVSLENLYWKTLKLAGIFACIECVTTEPTITLVEIKAAIYQAEFCEGQMVRLLQEKDVVVDVFEFLLQNNGATIMELREQRFINQTYFTKWFKDLYPYLLEYSKSQNYELKTDRFGKRGYKYYLEKRELTGKKYKISVADTNDPSKPKGFKVVRANSREIGEIIKQDRMYSPAEFKDGYRKIDNYIPGDELLMLDIDDTWTIEDAVRKLQEYKLAGIIATTRNHQKIKDKKPACDRFRIILPLLEPLSLNRDDYERLMVNVVSFFGGVADIASAKDMSRFYFGNSKSEVFYLQGDKFDISPFLEKKDQGFAFNPSPERPAEDNFFKVNNGEGIKNFFIENAVKGNRNNILYRAFKYYSDEGENAEQMVREINKKLRDPLTEYEVNQIVRRKK